MDGSNFQILEKMKFPFRSQRLKFQEIPIFEIFSSYRIAFDFAQGISINILCNRAYTISPDWYAGYDDILE